MNNTTSISKEKIVAIVPAAGIGSRMNLDMPKQYAKLGALTILEYTVNKLLALPLIDQIVIVIHPQDRFFATLPIAKYSKVSVAYGGVNRCDSVLAGLMLLNDSDWALVHDAARPCVSHTDIKLLITTVLNYRQGGILATRVTDTIKQARSDTINQIVATCDRKLLWAAATPQMFNAGKLRTSLRLAIEQGIEITDEASAIEYNGESPLLVECRRDNIKITREEDLALAKFYLTEQGDL